MDFAAPPSQRSILLRCACWTLACAVIDCSLVAAAEPAAAPQKSVPVRLVKTDDGYQLLRDGKPYSIKGAGGDGSRQALALAGGNSIRTWGADDKLGPLLDDAHELGLTVAVGIWLGHERHGFNYNDADQVAKQYEQVRQTIFRYRNHPAVLLWGLGNEMEGYGQGDNAAIWSAVNNLAALAKRLDPHHPTMTVVAEIGGDRVKNIERLCPEIDIIGVNSYGGVASLPKRYREAGGVKPYIVTEFGPPGAWESAKRAWGAPLEPTSTQKAEIYRRGYEEAIASQSGLCLGSYAFVWGHKQEATSTWFGMFLTDGTRLGAVDAMTKLWSGQPPANLCPTVESLELIGPAELKPGETTSAVLKASDPEHDPLEVRWELRRDADALGVGGDAEDEPPAYPEAIVQATDQRVELRMPSGGGNYRLFAFVFDNHGGAATANVPLRVLGPVVLPPARTAKLPLVIYDEADQDRPPYVPSGWMGDTQALKLSETCETQPHGGKTCLRIEYRKPDGWAGIVWQSPANDWGDKPGGFNLTGAKRLSFWARGEKGGEQASFEFGLIGRDKTYFDTAGGKLGPVELTSEWRQYTIDLEGKDLVRIKSGFVCVVSGKGQPLTFYLDDVRFE